MGSKLRQSVSARKSNQGTTDGEVRAILEDVKDAMDCNQVCMGHRRSEYLRSRIIEQKGSDRWTREENS
jgi:hypothetical protein